VWVNVCCGFRKVWVRLYLGFVMFGCVCFGFLICVYVGFVMCGCVCCGISKMWVCVYVGFVMCEGV